ncbi:prepilin peptidase [Geodermatophilus normandii]|uniref:prepilin peptidase n=1 Tax=Geodermatophilus normandii TaxID=1137989 RepID=UPI000D710AD9|nr:A24 family peptidase [Geodermatophilus normandii]
MSAAAVAPGVAALLGLAAGAAVDRAAARYPWPAGARVPVGAPAAPSPDAREEERPAVRPLLVLLTAVLCAVTTWRFGISAELPAYLLLVVAGVLLAAIDRHHHLLPNRVVAPTLVAGAVLLSGAAAVTGAWPALLRAVLAAAAVFGALLLMALVSPGGIGMGDVKLGAVLGLYLGWLGWPHVVLGVVAGFVVQALLALALVATRRVGLRAELPFGPALLLGTGLAVLAPLVA